VAIQYARRDREMTRHRLEERVNFVYFLNTMHSCPFLLQSWPPPIRIRRIIVMLRSFAVRSLRRAEAQRNLLRF
jgi:hypothetical protein